MSIFVGAIGPPPLGNLDKDLEICLEHVCFLCLHVLSVIVPNLISHSFSQALAPSKEQREKRADESAQAAKNAELEVLMKSHAESITKLETAYADLKHEKDNVTSGHRRLSAKHIAFTVKVE
jgi:hypothetical protein